MHQPLFFLSSLIMSHVGNSCIYVLCVIDSSSHFGSEVPAMDSHAPPYLYFIFCNVRNWSESHTHVRLCLQIITLSTLLLCLHSGQWSPEYIGVCSPLQPEFTCGFLGTAYIHLEFSSSSFNRQHWHLFCFLVWSSEEGECEIDHCQYHCTWMVEFEPVCKNSLI